MCVGKDRKGGQLSPGDVPPGGKRTAWALKGLKMSGAPSPPRTDRDYQPRGGAARMRRWGRVGAGGVKGMCGEVKWG